MDTPASRRSEDEVLPEKKPKEETIEIAITTPSAIDLRKLPYEKKDAKEASLWQAFKTIGLVPKKSLNFEIDKDGNFKLERDGKLLLSGHQKINPDGTTITLEKLSTMSDKNFAKVAPAFLSAACRASGLELTKTEKLLNKIHLKNPKLRKMVQKHINKLIEEQKKVRKKFHPTPLPTGETSLY